MKRRSRASQETSEEPRDPQTMKNKGFKPPNIWVIPRKNQGCWVPMTSQINSK